MAKIDRYNGNVEAFGSQAQDTERTVFGDTAQADDLDSNITADWLRGWGIVSVNEVPTKQDFNGLAFTLGQLIAYLHQRGVAEWNANQEYFDGSVVTTSQNVYRLKPGGDGSIDPETDDGTNWAVGIDSSTGVVDSVSELQSSSFPTTLTRLYLSGYYGAGTPGGGELFESSGSPDQGVKFQDGDGRIWERVQSRDFKAVDYGVRLDDASVDSSTQIQAAIDNLNPVVFNGGTFRADSPITISADRTLIFENCTSTVAANLTDQFHITGSAKVVVKGMLLDGDKNNFTVSGSYFDNNGSGNVGELELIDCEVKNLDGYLIDFAGVTELEYVNLQNTHVHDCVNSDNPTIRIVDCTNAHVRYEKLRMIDNERAHLTDGPKSFTDTDSQYVGHTAALGGPSVRGVADEDSQDGTEDETDLVKRGIVVKGVHSEENGGYQYAVGNSATIVSISNNTLKTSSIVDECLNFDTIDSVGSADGVSNAVSAWSVISNNVTSGGEFGIRINGAKKVLCSDNIVDGADDRGIGVFGNDSEDIIITDNILVDCVTRGSRGTNIVIKNNEYSGTVQANRPLSSIISISDDSFHEFFEAYDGLFLILCDEDPSISGAFIYSGNQAATAEDLILLGGGSNLINSGNTTLSGTTGADGSFNVGVFGGSIYLENRRGGPREFRVSFIDNWMPVGVSGP